MEKQFEQDQLVQKHEMLRRTIEVCTDAILKKKAENEAEKITSILALREAAVVKLTAEIEVL